MYICNMKPKKILIVGCGVILTHKLFTYVSLKDEIKKETDYYNPDLIEDVALVEKNSPIFFPKKYNKKRRA